MLKPEDAVRSFHKPLWNKTAGRYRNVLHYVFMCSRCNKERHVARYNMAVVGQLCHACATSKIAKETNCRYRKRPYEWLYNRLKFTSARRKASIAVMLTYEEFCSLMLNTDCVYCGVAVYRSPVAGRGVSEGHYLDRKDNAVGYSVENCVTACWPCNKLKGDRFSHHEMIAITRLLREMRGNQ
jgi:hypothetical protein